MNDDALKYIGIDIGQTWIKGIVIDENVSFGDISSESRKFDIVKIKNVIHYNYSIGEWIAFFKEIIKKLKVHAGEIRGLGISTSSVVNYSGTEILESPEFLSVLRSKRWNRILEKELKCKITLINDADATAISLAEIGALEGHRTIGVAPGGTEFGFTVWRNGRLWLPGKRYTLMDSIGISIGSFAAITNAEKSAELDENSVLIRLLTHSSFEENREHYFKNLTRIIHNVSIIYNLDKIIICGGLSDAARLCDFPLVQTIKSYLHYIVPELGPSFEISVSRGGNRLQLIGALLLA